MIKNMKRRIVSVALSAAFIALGLGFGLQQAKQTSPQKPKWETPEKDRQVLDRLLQDYPEILEDAAVKDLLARYSKEGMVGIWKEELRHPDIKRRARALKNATPEVLSAETAIPAIVPLLEDKSARVRFEAASALLRFGSNQGVGVLLQLLKAPGDSFRPDVVSVLIRYKKREAIPVIRELFAQALEQISIGKTNLHPANFIYYLAKALSAFEDRESYPLFEQYFHLYPINGSQSLDFGVVEAAGRLGEPQLAGSLQEIFNRSKDLAVKLAAAFGLAKLGNEFALRYLLEQVSSLRGAPEQELVQRDSEGGTHRVENPAFIDWSQERPPVHQLIRAAVYLGEVKAVQAFPLLTELALSENVTVVQAAVKALTLLGDKRAMPILVKLTNREHPYHVIAAQALLFFDAPEAEGAFRRVYNDESVQAEMIRRARELGPMEFLRP